MSLILLRADSQGKLLNSLADLERHAGLKIMGKPKLLNNEYADDLAQKILNRKIRKKSRVSVVIRVKESTTRSIMQVKKIHPPAHVIIVSEEYKEYESLKNKMDVAPVLKGYYSYKEKSHKK